MNKAVRSMHTSKVWYLLLVMVMLITLTSGITPDTATASEVSEAVEISTDTS